MNWRATPAKPAVRWIRLAGLTVVGLAVAAGAAVVVVPLLARGFVRAMMLTAAGCVWLATALSTGASTGTLLGTLWQEAAGTLATPLGSVVLWGLVALGAVAFYWLQRLLGPEEE